jgi:hypothetical protein
MHKTNPKVQEIYSEGLHNLNERKRTALSRNIEPLTLNTCISALNHKIGAKDVKQQTKLQVFESSGKPAESTEFSV